MKRRVLSLILATILCVSTTLALTSCGSHTFKTTWDKDETHHWHACEDEKCTEVADKAEHTWDEGKETTYATDLANGVMTYTCTVCKQTKTSPTTFNGVNITQYGMAVDAATLSNVTVTIKMKSGNQTKTSTLKLNGSEYEHHGETHDGTVSSSGDNADSSNARRNKYLFFAAIDEVTETTKVNHKDLIYDAAGGTYSTADDFTVVIEDEAANNVITYTSIVMTISGTLVQTVEAEITVTHGADVLYSGTIEIELSDYGTTEVDITSGTEDDDHDPYDPDGDDPDGGDPFDPDGDDPYDPDGDDYDGGDPYDPDGDDYDD